jgi:hypothetical protein
VTDQLADAQDALRWTGRAVTATSARHQVLSSWLMVRALKSSMSGSGMPSDAAESRVAPAVSL